MLSQATDHEAMVEGKRIRLQQTFKNREPFLSSLSFGRELSSSNIRPPLDRHARTYHLTDKSAKTLSSEKNVGPASYAGQSLWLPRKNGGLRQYQPQILRPMTHPLHLFGKDLDRTCPASLFMVAECLL